MINSEADSLSPSMKRFSDTMQNYQRNLASYQQDPSVSEASNTRVIAGESYIYAGAAKAKRCGTRETPYAATIRVHHPDHSMPSESSSLATDTVENEATSLPLDPVPDDACYSCEGKSGYKTDFWSFDVNGFEYCFCEGCLPLYQVINAIQRGEIVGRAILELQEMLTKFLQRHGIRTAADIQTQTIEHGDQISRSDIAPQDTSISEKSQPPPSNVTACQDLESCPSVRARFGEANAGNTSDFQLSMNHKGQTEAKNLRQQSPAAQPACSIKLELARGSVGIASKRKGEVRSADRSGGETNATAICAGQSFLGIVKAITEKFGFLTCEEVTQQYGHDVYFRSWMLPPWYKVGDQLAFDLVIKNGQPQATNLRWHEDLHTTQSQRREHR